ncbi:MAG: TIGR03088 family PEP-CTERM/XrtA system glycosyltransferase [Motiliproteus sp.]
MARPIHITHIVYHFGTGGLENGIVNLINHLPADRYRHSIVCLAGFDSEFVKRVKQPIHIESIDKAPGSDWKYYWPMWRVLRRLKPDVVHTRNMTSMEYQLPAFFARIKHRVHGEHGWDMSDLGGSNSRYVKLKQALRPLIHDFIALSAQSAEYLIDKVNVRQAQCYQIINGVDTERFTPVGEMAEAPAGFLDDNCIVFGCVGRLASVKNHRLLADAFIALCQSQPDIAPNLRLIIVGEGDTRQTLEQKFKTAKLSQQVWLAGNQQQIPDFMRLFDLFVLPSLAEGISNTILEAFASGLPVIATDVGGNGELVAIDKSGTLTPSDQVAPLAKAMADYALQPQKIKAQGINARQTAETKFSLSHMIDRYAAIYSRN